MNYATIKPLDVANGVGIRVSLFVSGCTHHCKGCFNPETWRFDYGQPFDAGTIDHIIDLMKEDYIAGLSILGGEPMELCNESYLLILARTVKEKYPRKTIWLYSGYTYEQLKGRELLKYADVLVDGEFMIELKNPKLKFRGSSNQRLIKLVNGEMVGLIEEDDVDGD